MAGFSERLRSLRAENRLIQSDLAKILEVTEATISYYESGRNEPNIAVVKRLADYFNVSLDYMIGISDYRKVEVPSEHLEENLAFAFRHSIKNLSQKEQKDVAEYIEFKMTQAAKAAAKKPARLKKPPIRDNR